MLSPPFTLPIVTLIVLAAVSSHAAEVSFRNDVQAAVAKAGCNLGTCHGNATGKGGFKMSLRGDDLDYDYAALTQDVNGRRLNLFVPERSLLLEKATQTLAHEGGKRFDTASWEYAVLRDWIAQGAKRQIKGEPSIVKLEVTPREQILVAPAATVQLKAIAQFSDGSQRDVTKFAVYEPAEVGLVKISAHGYVEKLKDGEPTIVVRYLNQQQPVRLAFVPARPEFAWVPTRQNNAIDRHIFAKLKALRMTPSAVCRDEVFARRVYLDLCGVPPSAAEAKAFVSDPAPDKRERLVEKLLATNAFADFWALKWADSLRVESRTMDVTGMTAFHRWIRDAVATNVPVDKFAHAILGATGSTYTMPPANFYRAMREPNARAEGIARVFLGTRLQCAQCHNHPFDRWTQNDYFQWSAVFARVDYKIISNKVEDKSDTHRFLGEQVVQVAKEAKLTHPRTGEKPKAKLLGASELDGATLDARRDLDAAAAWVTSPKNPFFAQAQVNRIWFHLMGRGLVDPIDDFRLTNPASHPQLLEMLTREFVQSGFDMRRVIRLITQSRTYQLSSVPNATNAADDRNFSHALVRRLSAEQVFDALHQGLGVAPQFAQFPNARRAAQLPGPMQVRKREAVADDSIAFLSQFGRPPRLLACECERSNESTMSQSFTLISGPHVNDLLRRKGNTLSALLSSKEPFEQKVDSLYWSLLTRAPTALERAKLADYVRRASDKRAAMEDMAWSLVNAKEFVLRN
ncbi:MAG: DUF1549 and DUF1553 domain-containing protein [Roseimicrobium sp.]